MNDFCVYNSVICIEFIPSTQTFGKVKKKKQQQKLQRSNQRSLVTK